MRSRLLLCLVVCASWAGTATAAQHQSDPETNPRLGPAVGAGHYLAGQSQTARWHGCGKSDIQWYPVSLLSGAQTTSPSTHRYVTFTVQQGAFPYFSWKAKAGYAICGVEAYATLANAQTGGSELLAWTSYKSGAATGATASDGKETVRVHLPRKLDVEDQPDLKVFEGQVVGIDAFQAVAVYVKRG